MEYIQPVSKDREIKDALSKTDLNKLAFAEYKGETPFVVMTYGSLTITVGCRGNKKSAKSYPVEIEAFGNFPDENDIKGEESSGILYDYHTLAELSTDMRQNIVYRSADELEAFIEKMTVYFKKKYKLTDTVFVGYYREENKLEIKK